MCFRCTCMSTVVSSAWLLTQALGKTGNGAWCEVSTPLTVQPWLSPSVHHTSVSPWMVLSRSSCGVSAMSAHARRSTFIKRSLIPQLIYCRPVNTVVVRSGKISLNLSLKQHTNFYIHLFDFLQRVKWEDGYYLLNLHWSSLLNLCKKPNMYWNLCQEPGIKT